MMGYTHAAIALLAAKLLNLISWNTWLEISFIIVIAMLPDIDQPRGLLSKVFRPLTYKLHEHFGHRAFTHSIFPFGLGVGLLGLISPKFALLFAIAYGLHILTDMLTYTGVKLFYPNPTHFVILGGPLITGKWTDPVIFVFCLAIVIALMVMF